MSLQNILKRINIPFLIILAFALLETLVFIAFKRMGVHDTFYCFSLYYYFLNNAVMTGEIPQWIPYLTHGRTAYNYFAIQGVEGFLQNIFYYIAPLLKNFNFLTVYHWGIFLDKLLLLTGTWLLGRRFFTSTFTVFFVTLTIMLSCVWLSSTYWNFYLYYALPLIIYLVHRFLAEGKWYYLFLALHLFILQSIAKLFYVVPVTSLTIFLYFFLYIAFNHKNVLPNLRKLQWTKICSLTLFMLILAGLSVFTLLKISRDPNLVYYMPDRMADGSVPLQVFLNYATEHYVVRWVELFLGISPCADYTVYMGLFSLPLIAIGILFGTKKENLHILSLIVTLIWISMGTSLAALFYYTWPLMKYYRHLSLIIPIIKLFLCFLAGYGLEFLLSQIQQPKRSKSLTYCLLSCSLFMLFLGVLIPRIIHRPDLIVFLKEWVVGKLVILLDPMFELIIQQQLSSTTLWAWIFCILFALLSLTHTKRWRKTILLCCLIIHAFDLLAYNSIETNKRSSSLTSKQSQVNQFQPLVYKKRRKFGSTENNNPREIIVHSRMNDVGANYWTIQAFLFKDPLHSFLRTDHAEKAFTDLVKMYRNGDGSKSIVTRKNRLFFPITHPAVLEITGTNRDKIQFFREAHILKDEKDIAFSLKNLHFKGNVLLLSETPGGSASETSPITNDWLSLNSRRRFPYQILRFDANHLIVKIQIPPKGSIWLYYADVWHPFWKATVNGKPTAVYKANLAYKAVRLQEGDNTVHFYFGSNLFKLAHFITTLNSLFWWGYLFLLLAQVVFNKEDENDPILP